MEALAQVALRPAAAQQDRPRRAGRPRSDPEPPARHQPDRADRSLYELKGGRRPRAQHPRLRPAARCRRGSCSTRAFSRRSTTRWSRASASTRARRATCDWCSGAMPTAGSAAAGPASWARPRSRAGVARRAPAEGRRRPVPHEGRAVDRARRAALRLPRRATTFSGGFEEVWGQEEPRESKMVFIGKNLDAKALAARFNACLATPENMQKKADALRFCVGDEVECNLGSGRWAPGRCTRCCVATRRCLRAWSRRGRVRLEGEEGRLIFVPPTGEPRPGREGAYARPPKTGGASGRRIPGIGAGPATIGRRIF